MKYDATPEQLASLERAVVDLSSQGYFVIAGKSWKHTVPFSYKWSYNTVANFYVFHCCDGFRIKAGHVETRTRGRTVPTRVWCLGAELPNPEGWRCAQRDYVRNFLILTKR